MYSSSIPQLTDRRCGFCLKLTQYFANRNTHLNVKCCVESSWRSNEKITSSPGRYMLLIHDFLQTNTQTTGYKHAPKDAVCPATFRNFWLFTFFKCALIAKAYVCNLQAVVKCLMCNI